MVKNSLISRRDFLKFSLSSGVLMGLGGFNSESKAQMDYTITQIQSSQFNLNPNPNLNLNSNPNLEESISSYLNKMRQMGVLLEDERLACNVYDFQSRVKLVGINDVEAFQTASMMKPFIALAFFQKVAETGINYNSKLRKYMKQMIEKSNNDATNKLMEFLGGPEKIEKILIQNFYEIFKQTKIVEYIPEGGKTYRNKASAEDYSRFLYALWNNNFPFSNEIKLHMSHTSKGRIKEGTQIPRGTDVYNKTGTTAMLYGDMGIFNLESHDGTKKAYSLVAMVEREDRISKRESKVWKIRKKQLLRGVSDIVYSDMKLRYDLV